MKWISDDKTNLEQFFFHYVLRLDSTSLLHWVIDLPYAFSWYEHGPIVFTGKSTFAYRTLGWLENLCYRIGGNNPKEEILGLNREKLFRFLTFSALSRCFFLQLLQGTN